MIDSFIIRCHSWQFSSSWHLEKCKSSSNHESGAIPFLSFYSLSAPPPEKNSCNLIIAAGITNIKIILSKVKRWLGNSIFEAKVFLIGFLVAKLQNFWFGSPHFTTWFCSESKTMFEMVKKKNNVPPWLLVYTVFFN